MVLFILVVHCHVGSLEIIKSQHQQYLIVHCHVGSLENFKNNTIGFIVVHCHVGSLESYSQYDRVILVRSLPCRQLRNSIVI